MIPHASQKTVVNTLPEPVRLQKPTVLTVPLSLECSSVFKFRPQLSIDAETCQNGDGKAPE